MIAFMIFTKTYISLCHTPGEARCETICKGTKTFQKLIDVITDHVEEIDLPYLGSVKLRNVALSYTNPLKELLTQFLLSKNKHIIMVLDELPFYLKILQKPIKKAKSWRLRQYSPL